MKIMICSSMKFAEDIIKVKEKLELIGHQVSIPIDTEYIIQNPDLPDNLEKDCEHLRSSGIIKKCFNLIAGSDCVLVLNYKKNECKVIDRLCQIKNAEYCPYFHSI